MYCEKPVCCERIRMAIYGIDLRLFLFAEMGLRCQPRCNAKLSEHFDVSS